MRGGKIKSSVLDMLSLRCLFLLSHLSINGNVEQIVEYTVLEFRGEFRAHFGNTLSSTIRWKHGTHSSKLWKEHRF